MFSCSVLLLALFAAAQGRAVNISNTWVLPEEGFPVFYRYFRDRISWYEADAVCQFHHANLVTVDTTAQYDAVRAYLKELDISSAVWVGLIRSNPDGDFTWTDYRGLSGDGYWSSAPDARAAPMCAAADPAADYRWEARACGGPTVASFICELPVPQWALGNEGCMVRALPALTILYLPESAAVQLTADCGLAGVKRVQCTGNVKRENLLKDLSCNEEDDLTTTPSTVTEESSTFNTDLTTNTTELETASDLTTEDDVTTKHEIEASTTQATPESVVVKEKLSTKEQVIVNKLNSIYSKNINLDLLHNNNLQSNDIPKLGNNENFMTMEQSEKLEDEKHMHHKMLHDELARHGNFETIFTQPTDHFVPPLVMAKAKISDDMTVLSLAEKHAQQMAEQQRYVKHNILNEHNNLKTTGKPTTEEPLKLDDIDKPLVMTLYPSVIKDSLKKDKTKSSLPKKYKEKYDDPKIKNLKLDGKLLKFEKSTERSSTPTDTATKLLEAHTTQFTETSKTMSEDNSLEITVILKEPKTIAVKQADDIAKFENIAVTTKTVLTTDNPITEPPITSTPVDQTTTTSQEILKKEITEITKAPFVSETSIANKEEMTSEIPTTQKPTTQFPINTDAIMQDVVMNHEVIKITIVNDNDKTNPTHTVFEITTLVPEFKDAVKVDNKSEQTEPPTTNEAILPLANNTTYFPSTGTTQKETAASTETSINHETIHIKTETNTSEEAKIVSTDLPLMTKTDTFTTIITNLNETNKSENHSIEFSQTTNNPQSTQNEKIEVVNFTEIYDVDSEKNSTDPDVIDDLNSPLLSAANEPLHRPNRSRRPQPPNRLAKFNPFRILG